MSTNFLSLPSELRNNIYEQLLVLQEPISITMFWEFQPQELTPGLLRANKTIHGEASFVLYAYNRFDLTFCNPVSFLEQIGRNNASFLLYISVGFPQFEHLNLQDITLEEDSSRTLAKIQSHCTGLKTLQTSLDSTNEMEHQLAGRDDLTVVAAALGLVDARLKEISSLPNIIVEVYGNGPSDSIRNEMENHGWIINATESVEEPDFYSDDGVFILHDWL
ncbi:hypothetical protein DSL72_006614 [Monilinia vaccinii-corymbosi]|uniref:Uncharacterized protein n=1 Tax=Monilinia vaccinii-corymbosi TaxID=61207 RepID=A0A8A3PPD4_9HELO|nr:hypothetical protein DSL72_006614 [Monilinia vaccinii-corymbosi]